MSINSKIFKAYDIRGIYPDEVNEDTFFTIARAIADYFKPKKIVLGKDIRFSSDTLEKALVDGFLDQGVLVEKIGLSTTPMLYFASSKLDVDLGIMVTASHNPAEYNGLKICLKNAVPVGAGSGMEEIKNLSLKNEFSSKEKGDATENKNFRNIYLDFIKQFYKPGQKRKIVIDFANAMGIIDREIFESFEDVEAVYLYDNFDGKFPNHEANPLKTETLKDLQNKVKIEQANFGVAYDGDADRVGFVDEKGEVVPMDFITALLAKEVLEKYPGSKILIDLRSSNAVREFIEEAGGEVSLCRVGHSLIKKQMREENAVFAGELSGHYYFKENSNAELSSLAIIYILNLLNKSGKKLSELIKPLQKYYHSGEINSRVNDTQKIFKKIKEKYSDGKISELDGVRIDYSDWWFNLRASNTEPLIRLNLEAKTKELMEEKKQEILNFLQNG